MHITLATADALSSAQDAILQLCLLRSMETHLVTMSTIRPRNIAAATPEVFQRKLSQSLQPAPHQ
eukprot:3491301-Amphidinium_carterae.2